MSLQVEKLDHNMAKLTIEAAAEDFEKAVQQAYLKNQPEKGYKVIYDWLVQPDTFQALMEGRYKDNRSKYGDDWEVVDLG